MHEGLTSGHPASPVLEIRDATYTYDGEKLPVWEHLSCCFYEGKIHVLSGPSGCGKSSVLSLLDGLIPHMYEGDLKGKVFLRGEDISEMPPDQRCGTIGLVFQNPESQFATFTVGEELAFGMENLCVPREEMEVRIARILDFIGLPGLEERSLDDLSGGQKQKIAIGSILITEPEILLLDEPTANLDPESRRQIFDLILRISREKKTTIILVEHNIAEIIGDVDYYYAMGPDGTLLKSGSIAGGKEEFLTLTGAHVPPSHPEDLTKDETVLSVQDLHFSYARNGPEILSGLSLELKKQEFLAVIGRNGAGKTTLLKIIFRILKAKDGRITLFRKPLSSYSPKELYRRIGLVFQNPEDQFVENSVFDEMMFSLKKVRMPEEEKKQRVMKMLRQFHLDGDPDKSPFVLSQGQKRRLSVACMLLTGQEILFLDEPTYGQDPENRRELMQDMQALVRKGMTIVMITHDLSLVRQYATRVVRLENGRLEEVPEDAIG